MVKEQVWTTANGEDIKFSELEHQHLSNILWFNEIIRQRWVTNDYVSFLLTKELKNRFGGKRLLWKPLPVSGEIEWLKKNGFIQGNGIVRRREFHMGGYVHELIGTIEHIKDEV